MNNDDSSANNNAHSVGPLEDKTQGVSEETSLTVRLLNGEWIVETGLGEAVGGSPNRAEAVKIARANAARQRASSISVLNESGEVEENLTP